MENIKTISTFLKQSFNPCLKPHSLDDLIWVNNLMNCKLNQVFLKEHVLEFKIFNDRITDGIKKKEILPRPERQQQVLRTLNHGQ